MALPLHSPPSSRAGDPQSYDSLHRHARSLEDLLDAKLTAYSKLAVSISREQHGHHTSIDMSGGVGGGRREEQYRDAEADIEELLEKLSATTGSLSALLPSPSNPADPSAAPLSTAQIHAIDRHHDVLLEYSREFRRTKANVQSALDSADLLGSVKRDIDAYKAARTADQEALLGERGRIDNSHRMLDNTLGQAYETRAEFNRQASSLAGISQRMGGVLSTLPGINSLIGLISARRRRDAIIMGCLIGVCIILLLSYMTR